MKLPPYVKSKKYIDFLPVLGKSTANAIYPFIFLPEKIFKDLKGANPNPRNKALLRHEETHRKRQVRQGIFKFWIKYLLNPKFRFNEELMADIEYMKVIKNNNLKFNIEKRAKQLSGHLYLWSTNYKKAKNKLEEAWNRK